MKQSAIDVPIMHSSAVSPPNSTSNVVKVHVSKDSMKLNAAHFIAYKVRYQVPSRNTRDGALSRLDILWQGFREKLNSHIYRLAVTIAGHFGLDGYKVDLGEIRGPRV
ncbi:hypothetical protein GN244_ATG08193 [Phytophthora infestans]|uniref:Uncharacterized protein n=1 Tax=Phytophthora infestans TaxID=4787 RepID=A0A833SY15_PHYIN|nr:hypothetical protein GN244_ATG08193 [Phytophthora infestans]KAF4143830.1 hypothetical protein GN958_ATG06916 [Phytophthora infestans]